MSHASGVRARRRRIGRLPLAMLVTAVLSTTMLAVPGLSLADAGVRAGQVVLVFDSWPPTWAEFQREVERVSREHGEQRAASRSDRSSTSAASRNEAERTKAERTKAERTEAEQTGAESTEAGTQSGSGTSGSGTSGSGTGGSGSSGSGTAGSASASGPTSASPPAPDATTTTAGSSGSGGTGTATATSSAGRPYIAYSADSFFRKPLPASTPVSSQSASFVAHAKAKEPFPYLKIRGAHGVGWGIAYAMADCSDPVYKIGSGGNLPKSQEHLRTTGFHAPASLWQDIPPNGDAPFLVIDTCGTSARPGGQSVWGANTVVSGQTVNTSAAGAFAHDTNGLDRRNPRSDSQLNERSRGVIPDSMAVRLDLLQHAIRNSTGLGHVLEVFWMETDTAAGFAHPMVGEEGGKSGVGAEGQRFRIKAGIDLASRPGCNPATNPVGLAIARTLQQHGAYLGDNSGSGSGIKTEQNANFPGLNADSLRGCMTWDDIEFLPLGYDG